MGPQAAVRLVLAVAVLGGLSVAVSDQTYLAGEVGLVEAVNAIPTWAGWPLRVLMQAGTLVVGLGAVVAVAVATWVRDRRPAVATFVAVAVAFRLDNVLKDLIERPRPPAVLDGLHVRETIDGFGFPSGHTTMAFAIAATLAPVVPVRWRWVTWAAAALVGVARMHVGVHWPADVVGGAALGTAIGTASWLLVHAVPAPRRSATVP